MVHRAAAIVLLVVVSSCGGPTVRTVDGELRVSPDRIEFPRTFVSHPTRSRVTFQNTGKAARTVVVKIDAPFQLGGNEGVRTSDSFALAGGSSRDVELIFDPIAPTVSAGALVAESDAQTVVVALAGAAETPKECPKSWGCEVLAFDPESGECAPSVLPDGAECERWNKCLVDGVCESGSCVGTAPQCDDDNPCTDDVCDPGMGCVALDASNRCPPSTEPCLAASCDPATGCGLSPVADGTPCGASDCVTANVCVDGSCKAVPVPDGYACGEETPCQAKGTCQSQACVQPPREELKPKWSYAPGPDRDVSLGGTDVFGNLYFSEYVPPAERGTCELVSLDTSGAVRFRVDAGCPSWVHLVDHGRLFSGERPLTARSTLDGSSLWSRDFIGEAHGLTLAAANCPPQGGPLRYERTRFEVVSGGAGVLYVLVAMWGDFQGCAKDRVTGTHLFASSPTNGEIVWVKSFWEQTIPNPPVADESGNVYLGIVSPEVALSASLHSFAPGGQLRWQAPAPNPVRELAVFDGVIVHGARERFSTATGASLTLLSPTPTTNATVPVFLSPQTTFTLGISGARIGVTRLEAASGSLEWTKLITLPAWYFPDAFLTSQDTMLVPGYASAGTSSVAEVDRDGYERMSCPMKSFTGILTPLFVDDLLITVAPEPSFSRKHIHAFELPGRKPARRGWMSMRGSPEHNSRPR